LADYPNCVAHFVPKYLQNRMPSWETNCIEDWETKVDGIVDETINENMSVISEFRLSLYLSAQSKSNKPCWRIV
jgi:hypothetical protein